MSAWSLLNLLNLPLSIIQNAFNASFQAKQNKHNEKLVDMQNKAAEKQAEKAYIRSLPSNQIQNMRSAGISDFAAAQAISGGGTYQPAPVNTSQGQAPQIDLNGAMQAITNSMQMKQEMKMQDKLLAAQKAENAANRATQKEIAQLQADSAKYSADTSAGASRYGADKSFESAQNRLDFDKSVHDFFKDKRNELLEKEIQSYVDNHKASVQQREHFETIKPFLKDKADEEVKLIRQQIQRAKDQSDVEYKEYLLDKIRTSIYAKYGVRIDELRNSIDFWTRDRGTLSYTIGYPGNNKKLRELENVEKDFLNYLIEIDKMLEELDKK